MHIANSVCRMELRAPIQGWPTHLVNELVHLILGDLIQSILSCIVDAGSPIIGSCCAFCDIPAGASACCDASCECRDARCQEPPAVPLSRELAPKQDWKQGACPLHSGEYAHGQRRMCSPLLQHQSNLLLRLSQHWMLDLINEGKAAQILVQLLCKVQLQPSGGKQSILATS